MYILVRQVFKGDNYSREETINLLDFFSATSIQGRQLFKGGNYSRKYGIYSSFLLYILKYRTLSKSFLPSKVSFLQKFNPFNRL